MKIFSSLKFIWHAIINFKLFNLKIRFFDNGILSLFKDTVELNTRQGIYKIYTKDKAIGRALFLYGAFEEGFLTPFKSFLENNSQLSKGIPFLLIDIGANIGISTIALSRLKLISNSIAIEPDDDNFQLLEYNIKRNGLSETVQLFQYAVSDKKGTCLLDKDFINYGHHSVRKNENSIKPETENYSHTISVPMNTLPNILKEANHEHYDQPVLLWVDIEGHEGYLLQGAKEWIKDHPVICVMEVFPDMIESSGMSIPDFTSLVKTIWTHFFILRHGRFIKKPIDLFDYAINQLHGVDREENIVFINDKIATHEYPEN